MKNRLVSIPEQLSMSSLRASLLLLPALLPIAEVSAFLNPTSSALPTTTGIPNPLNDVGIVGIAGIGAPATNARPKKSPTSLDVWWFGGTPDASEISTSGEECELVAVRIDKTSPNSRRISGEIVVNAPLQDVWAILTDYDNLSTHVPNLVASKRVPPSVRTRRPVDVGEPGDGSYQCRLYQRGAQKIIGFEFGADVTMDMAESFVVADTSGPIAALSDESSTTGRAIGFKCINSQFFSEFDGEWQVVEMPVNPFTNEPETTLQYTVEVRPKGPVPVGALEWRIREDVPTNLRAVKKAAIEVGHAGVMAMRNGDDFIPGNAMRKLGGGGDASGSSQQGAEQDSFADFILDYENETLGAYMAKD